MSSYVLNTTEAYVRAYAHIDNVINMLKRLLVQWAAKLRTHTRRMSRRSVSQALLESERLRVARSNYHKAIELEQSAHGAWKLKRLAEARMHEASMILVRLGELLGEATQLRDKELRGDYSPSAPLRLEFVLPEISYQGNDVDRHNHMSCRIAVEEKTR